MPYVITTKQRIGQASCHEMGVQPVYEPTRRAVATLDEARTEAHRSVDHIQGSNYPEAQLDAIGEFGGTIGPLPDGTVIEVERITYDALAGQVFDRDDYAPVFELDILAAFNAARA